MTEKNHHNPSRVYVLVLLTALSAMTFMDRQILSVLLQPIKQEFGFSDLQIGLITGLGFALAFGALGIPMGRLADKHERRSLIAWCRGIGGCIASAGALASGAGGLTASRAGAALGDAGGGAASMSILADLYAPGERSRAMSVFGVGGAIGALLALLLGPLFAELWGWRAAMAVIGLAIVLLSLVLRLTVAEPVRALSHATASEPAARQRQSAVLLIWSEPVTRFLIAGAACALIAGLSIGAWNVAL
ncbi:MAG: MFS transporter, partial [Comamonas sp.]|nr:MFS transporter [Comamonas sp.]